ncbi:MAG: hypothetical protein ACKPKO_05160, partial [Candidatus Fonsibacter sp.]
MLMLVTTTTTTTTMMMNIFDFFHFISQILLIKQNSTNTYLRPIASRFHNFILLVKFCSMSKNSQVKHQDLSHPVFTISFYCSKTCLRKTICE